MGAKSTKPPNREHSEKIADLLKQHQLSHIKAVDENGNTILHLVVENENSSLKEKIEVLGILLDEGADPNIKNSNGETALHLAIRTRAKEIIDFLLTRKIKFDNSVAKYLLEDERKKFKELKEHSEMPDNEKQKIESESASFVEWLLSKGLNVVRRNKENPSALELALEFDLQHILPTLLKSTTKIKFVDERKNTLLHLFLKRNDSTKYKHSRINKNWYSNRYAVDIVKIFLSKGLSVDAENTPKETPIEIAINNKEDVDIVEMLIEHSTKIHRKNTKGDTLFNVIIEKWTRSKDTESHNDYYMRIARALMSKGADTNAPNGSGKSPLLCAIDSYNLRVVEFLRDNGADLSLISEDNGTLLHSFLKLLPYRRHVSTEVKMRIFELLLEHTVNVNRKNSDGETLFCMLIRKWSFARKAKTDCYLEMAHALISKGADVNVSDRYGRTPIQHAVAKHNLPAVELLGENGADFSVRNRFGESLMHSIARKRRLNYESAIKIFDILIRHGCRVNVVDDDDALSPLHIAAYHGSEIIVRRLLEHGADVDCRNRRKATPLIYLAGGYYFLNIAELLLEHGADVSAKDAKGSTIIRRISFSSDPEAIKFLRFLSRHCIKLDVANMKCSVTSECLNLIYKRGREFTENRIKVQSLKKSYRRYYKTCSNEVESLKSFYIDSRISLYNFLHMDPNSRRAYVINEDLQQLIHSSKLKELFPEYAILILASYREAVLRKELLEPARKAWLQLTNISLPDVCIERILSFLSNSDLFGIVEKD